MKEEASMFEHLHYGKGGAFTTHTIHDNDNIEQQQQQQDLRSDERRLGSIIIS